MNGVKADPVSNKSEVCLTCCDVVQVLCFMAAL